MKSCWKIAAVTAIIQADRVSASQSIQTQLRRLADAGYIVVGKRAVGNYSMGTRQHPMDIAYICVRRRDWVEIENKAVLAFKSAKEAAYEALAADPNRDFFVWWDRITDEDLDRFEELLTVAQREEEMQSFIKDHPALLVQHLGGGHGRWVVPKQRLGAEHVTDFVVASCDSIGHHWWAVELESPKAKPFTKSGDPSRFLSHAIRQVSDWRSWLTTNQNYAARPRTEHGLGLTQIDNHVHGLIVIGREADFNDQANVFRRRQQYDANIQIHSYDWLLSTGRNRRVDLVGSTALGASADP